MNWKSAVGRTAVVCLLSGAGQATYADPAATPLREAYYGDLHLHTGFSFDAYIMFSMKTTPEEAYRFARGEAVNFMGASVKRNEPLDFMAVTDHAENLGVAQELQNPASVLAKTDLGHRLNSNDPRAFAELVQLQQTGRAIPGVDLNAYGRSAWQAIIDAANRYYEPGKFSTLIGYEWTSHPDNQNLHRNVIFRGDTAPLPFTAVDSRRPEDLWTYLEANRKRGIEALAIPHNGNASNGLMYDWNDSDGRPIDQGYAMRRALNEPLSEISQAKGQSETHPLLSPSDEFAGFEVFDYLFGNERTRSKIHGGYVREAYGRGLVIGERTGANPYRMGMVGGSDYHTGLSISSEADVAGSSNTIPQVMSAEEIRVTLAPPGDHTASLPQILCQTGNLTGVWAEENTRGSIYDALKRKETFATSGTRVKFRFFGGWDYPRDLQSKSDWIRTAYARGVPMGGDLPAPSGKTAGSGKAGKPRFAIWAIKDPNGANLDRVQVVKVWLKSGAKNDFKEPAKEESKVGRDDEPSRGYAEKVFDVAWSKGRTPDPRTGRVPAVGDTVNMETATYTNTIGATELAVVWEDPEFDATVPAVYYLRVLEIPTPRWSTVLAVRKHLPLSKDVTPSIQERGWSSPIWYSPNGPKAR